MTSPIPLPVLKDDLGIAVEDTTQDAWLTRRNDGIWQRMESYCQRHLGTLMLFQDTWGSTPSDPSVPAVPVYGHFIPAYLRQFPISSISKFVFAGEELNAGDIDFDAESGRILGLKKDGTAPISGNDLIAAQAVIEYAAGFDPYPSELYEVVLNAILPQWGSRQAAKAGGTAGLGAPRSISPMGVGTVEFGSANTPFLEGALRGSGGNADPLIGPFTSVLDPYVDHRVMLGGSFMPVSKMISTIKARGPIATFAYAARPYARGQR